MGPDDPRYAEAVDAYFTTIDSCAGIRLPRHFPHVGHLGYSLLARRSRCQTVCYNTCIAPHNLEGTFLGLGDAYLKQGKLKQARVSYESVKRAPSYPSWRYKDVLKTRLANLEALACKFRAGSGSLDVVEPAMFFQSSYSCTACHAR